MLNNFQIEPKKNLISNSVTGPGHEKNENTENYLIII